MIIIIIIIIIIIDPPLYLSLSIYQCTTYNNIQSYPSPT